MGTTSGRASVTVREAAQTLGITERAVRLRVEKGTLRGTIVKGKWIIYLPLEATVPSADFPASNGKGKYEPEAALPTPESQLQMVMSAWVQPLVDQIGSLQREVGSLSAQLAEAQHQRDALAELVNKDDNSLDDLPRGKTWLQRLFGL